MGASTRKMAARRTRMGIMMGTYGEMKSEHDRLNHIL